jgi:hypothetical protein
MSLNLTVLNDFIFAPCGRFFHWCSEDSKKDGHADPLHSGSAPNIQGLVLQVLQHADYRPVGS